MTTEPGDRLWLLYAPPGVWSSGPLVVIEKYSLLDESYQSLIDKGWEVEGPFVRAKNEPFPLANVPDDTENQRRGS